MKAAWVGLVVVLSLAAAPLVKREALRGLETGFTDSLRTREMEILAFPSGLYVEGVGVVFTSEVNLTYTPMANPFQQTFPPEYKARIREKELKQLPLLRQEMKQLLLRSSMSLETLPQNEKIVVGVKVSHQMWEDKSGLPEQIVMQGMKAQLMSAKLGKLPVDDAIKVQEQ